MKHHPYNFAVEIKNNIDSEKNNYILYGYAYNRHVHIRG